MHVVLATAGTDGDVFPHVGLGVKLRERGHRVTLAAPEPYGPLAGNLGLGFRPLVSSEEVGRMLAHPDLFHPYRSGPMMARWGGAFVRRQYELLAELTREPDTAVVANPGVLAARILQDARGVRTASLLLQPGLLPSIAAPPVMPGGLTLPRWVPKPAARLYWGAVDAAGYALVARALNPVRAELGLPPVRRLFHWWLSPELAIGLFPEWYAAPQPDWPAQLRLAGFGRYDGSRGGELAADVRDFCAAGDPPVAFTLGTGMTHAARFFRAAAAACTALSCRGVLLTKYAHQLPRPLPPAVRHIAFAPFRRLLPLCGAVVHHGGIGTTAAALAAGVPQLVIPLAWDQPDNAARVRRLGVGESLGPRERSAGHITRALGKLMALAVRERCRAITATAGHADGLDAAARMVEAMVQRRIRA